MALESRGHPLRSHCTGRASYSQCKDKTHPDWMSEKLLVTLGQSLVHLRGKAPPHPQV